MEENQEVFLSMKNEIEKQSQREVDAIMAEVKKIEEEAYSSMRAEAKKDADLRLKQELDETSPYIDIPDEMQSESAAEISESHVERQNKLINKRDEYVTTIFKKAREELVAFTKTPEYKEFMVNKAKKLAGDYMPHSVIYVKEEDLGLADDLKAAYGDAEVKAGDITIGGLIVENTESSIVHDETLEFALKNQKEWFIQHSGLIINK